LPLLKMGLARRNHLQQTLHSRGLGFENVWGRNPGPTSQDRAIFSSPTAIDGAVRYEADRKPPAAGRYCIRRLLYFDSREWSPGEGVV